MDAIDRVPLKALRDKGPLWVPAQISAETAHRLQGKGWADIMDARDTPKAQRTHLLVALSQAGLKALRVDPA